jgi:hypothetical protein
MASKIRIDESLLLPKPEAIPLWNKLQALQLEHATTPCREDPTKFIDEPDTVSEDEAELLCHKCPLLKACFDFAKANDERWGIWGGVNFTDTTQQEELF